jgi:hypothetical protein
MERHQIPPHNPALLFQFGPKITELFNGPKASELIDPVVVIVTDEDPPSLHIVERLQITAALSVVKLYELSPRVETLPVLAIISGAHGGVQYTIPNPRLEPKWYERGLPADSE